MLKFKLILDNCMDEGLKDGRMFLLEVLRFLPNQRSFIFSMLFDTVKVQGMRLNTEINELLEELAVLKLSKQIYLESSTSTKTVIDKDSSGSNKTKKNITESDFQLPTLKKFTARNSQPKKFLKSLETISYLQVSVECFIKFYFI